MLLFQIISAILGILGFIMSLLNAIYFFRSHRIAINMYIDKYVLKSFSNEEQAVCPLFLIENMSQLPISITRIRLIFNSKKYDAFRLRRIMQQVINKSNNEIYDRQIEYTNLLPINLSSLEAFSGYLAFLVPRDTVSEQEKYLTFEICTNRGKAFQKTFLLQ